MSYCNIRRYSVYRASVKYSSAAPRRPEYSYRPRPAGGRRPAAQHHRCGRPRGSVARAVALHCKSAAPGAATVRKEPYSRTLPGDRPVSFRRAGRSRPRAGRPRPALHPDGTTACRPGARRRRLATKAARSRQRIARSPPPAALPDAAQRWRGAAAPLQQLLRRGAARRRARAHSVDGWTTVATLSAACGAAGPRAARARSPGPGRAIGRAARKKTRRVLVRGRGSTMNRHTHTAHARNEGRGRRTHTTNTLRARRDGRHERSIRHTHPIQKCDRVPSEYAEPGLRRGRWHNLQIDGTARPSYGGRWLLRRAFSRSTRWLMWSWTTCFV